MLPTISGTKMLHQASMLSRDTPPQIWLIGGTTEGLELAELMAQRSLRCTVSVTTDVAKYPYPCSPLLQICIRQFNYATLTQFLTVKNVAVILDASHPHAAEISTLAIQVAQDCQIPYLRVERPPITEIACGVQEVQNVAAVLTPEYLLGQRVLLTLGAKALNQFQPWQSRSTLFARILPSKTALQAAMAAGFAQKRLIALRPPISIELEMALWQQWNIERVVTKASGQPGGEGIKRQVAEALGIPLVVIQRPQLA
ncbi:MAG: cobalt-precorrin-6A reductase, partial [Cyanobacteria bacterium P01_A01_bin.17]